MKRVWITGATGFIGGAIAIELHNLGYEVGGVDRVFRSHLDRFYKKLVISDYRSVLATKAMFDFNPDTIIHCAASVEVGQSVRNPISYYNNNTTKTAELLCDVVTFLPNAHFMFSSTGTVYEPGRVLNETAPKSPVSPYSKSKYMVEQILEDCSNAYDLKYTCFRYFNACGAVGDTHGQSPESTHIFARLMDCFNHGEQFTLFGTNFPTKDGTCIRDYIHVRDIVDAHVVAIQGGVCGVYNLGSGFGYSNRDCIKAVSDYYGRTVPIIDGERRPGDITTMIADASKANAEMGWKATRDIRDVVESLDLWYNSKTYKIYKELSDEQVGNRQAV